MKTINSRSPIILASKSPRRKRLLEQAHIEFSVVDSLVDEDLVSAATPQLHALTLAEAKAWAVAQKHPEAWIIGADSIVVIDDMILNKPDSAAHAKQMLNHLSGRTHRVITGYSIMCKARNQRKNDTCITHVTFKDLTGGEIDWYLGTPEPWDKAGAYAIQGIAAFMIKSIQGSYTNVVGLPVCEVLDYLLKHKIIDRTTEKIHKTRLASGI